MLLPAILDLGAAAPLKAALLERRGEAIALDASGVERFGGACLQVLIAARNAWASDGAGFSIVEPSPAFVSAVEHMGAREHLNLGGGM